MSGASLTTDTARSPLLEIIPESRRPGPRIDAVLQEHGVEPALEAKCRAASADRAVLARDVECLAERHRVKVRRRNRQRAARERHPEPVLHVALALECRLDLEVIGEERIIGSLE